MKLSILPRSLGVIVGSALFLALTLTVTTTIAHPAEPQSASSANAICFVSETVTCVNRPALSASGTLTDQVRSLIEAMLLGPTKAEQAQGVQSALPGGTQLSDVRVTDQQVAVDLIVPSEFIKSLTDDQVEAINEQFRTTFTPFNFRRIDVNARDESGAFRPVSSFLPKIEIPRKEPNSPLPSLGEGLGVRAGLAGAGLSGKTVFVSAGHGWYWHTTLGTYKTQRPVYPISPYPTGGGVIEDFNNAEAVNQYLLKYLENAGADSWTVRERDLNTNMIIVDDGGSGFSAQGVWTTASGGYNSGYRFAPTSVTATATATWSFTPALSSIYAVYVRYPTTTTQSAPDTQFYVEHAGGTTPITLTQARDGNNWRYIGQYPFYAGQAARIRLTNQSSMTTAIVLADAVRIGGGIGDTSVAGAPISNKPRWEEQSRQYAKWVGMPDVDNLNDVIVRPLYSEWEKEASEDAVYISWHTNGYNGYNTTARGTESYIHSFEPTPNSNLLQNFVHTSLLSEIQTGWDATWPDRGEKSMDLGELRLLSTMPGVLIENGYHDNPTDVEAMKDARFMQLSARAIYHGLVKYWHSIDPSVPLIFLPEPPTHLIVRNSGAGQITLSWQPGPTDGSGPLGDVATSYRVYTSLDGFGWDNGVEVTGTTHIINGLSPNQLIYVKVTGVNAGGESFATPVLAARVAAQGLAPILIVYGFDRIDRLGDIQQNDTPEGLNRRVFVDRINRQDYILQHADAITRPFDSAQHAAVSDDAIALGNYTLVDWLAGEEQSPFPPLTTADQTRITNFLNNGGALFISGSEIGFVLQNTPFYATTLHAAFVNDDANTYATNSVSGGIFEGLGTLNFDDGTHGTYNIDYADVFNPSGSATSALVYNTGGSAAVQYKNGCTGLVYSGVPFESIYPATTRRTVMTRIINYLGACLPPDIDTTILAPVDGALLNAAPSFDGAASSNATSVQVSVRRVSDTTFYNGTNFVTSSEIWLNANGTNPWTYTLPAFNDGAYALRARAIAAGPLTDTTPAAITFTLDTLPPDTPTLITPTGGISLVTTLPQLVWTAGGDPDRFMVQLDGITHTVISPAVQARFVVTDGLHYWRVQAVDAAGNQSDWSTTGTFSTTSFRVYLPLIGQNFASEVTPPAGTCSDRIVNGNFEAGDLSGWTRPSQSPPATVVTDTVFAGTYSARVGKAATDSTSVGFSSIQQDVTIPANALTATLSFERYRYSSDLNNLQYVAVLSGTTVLDYLAYDQVDDPHWLNAQFDLLPYIGQTIGLRFSVWNKTASAVTGMMIDDVKLQVCVP